MISLLSVVAAFVFHCQPVSSFVYDKVTEMQNQTVHCVTDDAEFDVVRTYKDKQMISEYSDQLEYFSAVLDQTKDCELIGSEPFMIGTERGLRSVYLCKKYVAELISSPKYTYASLWANRFVYAKYRSKVE